jgi:hypothetical protein
MSKRKQPQKVRGPSRPVDPRYVPGRPARRGPDNFALGLIAVSLAAAIVIVLFIATQRGPTTATPTTTDPVASITQTSIAFNNLATTLQHATPQEALALHSANNAKFIDVRVNTEYVKQHIKGAVNIPYPDAQARLSEFPKDGNVILYCQ